MRVDDHHTKREGSQASKRSFRALFHQGKSRREGAAGVAEAQLPFGVVTQHPEAFFGFCYEKVGAANLP